MKNLPFFQRNIEPGLGALQMGVFITPLPLDASSFQYFGPKAATTLTG